MVAGTLTTNGVATTVSGRLRGTELTLEADGASLRAVVNGDRLEGTQLTGTRTRP